MALDIGPIRSDEIEAVVALWQATGLTRPWNDPYRDIAFARAQPTSCVLAGREDGLVAASCVTGHDGHRGQLYYLAVSPDRQGRGYGRLMVEAAEDWLRERGVWKMNLLVRSENVDVIGFYEAMGYEKGNTIQFGKRIDHDVQISTLNSG
jgi:ribosomal protein S18 acetylase RimI-like enzyme